MLKFLGCILIILSSTLSGLYFSNKLKQRRDFLKDFLSFLNSLKTQLRYSSGDMFQIIPLCTNSQCLTPFINKIKQSDNKISFREIWTQSLSILSKSNSLKKSDIDSLVGFGKELGTTDVKGELSHIDLYTEVFTTALKNAQEEIDKKSRLYKSMGFFLGTSITLMIV